MIKIHWKTLLICIAIPLAVGGLAALLTQGAMADFAALNKPPLSPPAWAFPVVWSILYVLMGIASYLIITSGMPYRAHTALIPYGVQLAFNFVWSLIFFGAGRYLFAFVWLVVLWLLILATALLFSRLRRAAAYLLIPYLVWVAFAGYLNFAIYLLN